MLKLTLIILSIVALDRAYSWGGRFNRFSPEMLSNMGYGGYGNSRHTQVHSICKLLKNYQFSPFLWHAFALIVQII